MENKDQDIYNDILAINLEQIEPNRFSLYDDSGLLVFERQGMEYEEVFAECKPYAIKNMKKILRALNEIREVQNKIKTRKYK